MLHSILVWLGFAQPKGEATHDHAKSHGHTHGVIDSTLATTTQGIWAIKWSFAILGVTSLLQLAVVYASSKYRVVRGRHSQRRRFRHCHSALDCLHVGPTQAERALRLWLRPR